MGTGELGSLPLPSVPVATQGKEPALPGEASNHGEMWK